MTVPTWLTSILNDAGRLHLTNTAVQIAGILAGLVFGIFGHDWQTGGEIAITALGASAGVSQMARKASK